MRMLDLDGLLRCSFLSSIDQRENGAKTAIMAISPPKNYTDFYKDNSVYELGAKNFFRELQRAISSDDRPKVARLCKYPLTVNVGGKQLIFKERTELLARYTGVFTSKVKEAVMNLQEPIHMGWRGFMTDRGEVWLDLVVGTEYFRVGAINVP